VVDCEAEYGFDNLDWQVFDGIEEVGGVLFPQHVHQVVVTGDESTLFGVLSVHQPHRTSYSAAYRSTHGRIVGLNLLPDCLQFCDGIRIRICGHTDTQGHIVRYAAQGRGWSVSGRALIRLITLNFVALFGGLLMSRGDLLLRETFVSD
jgi:hypothetical protein